MKILFLDIDGVVNCKTTNQRHRGFIGIDPYLAFLIGKIVLDTECKVVLSSSWRKSPDGIEEVQSQVTQIFDTTGVCCSGIRGVEIYNWLQKHKEVTKYAILDDEGDMLLWQKDNFFQTSWETGITPEIAQKVTDHLR